jgi:O-antigen ligase
VDDSLIAMLEVNADRLFSYISSEGLDMSQTSNRDSVFETAMVFISDSPLWGYGLFGYYDVLGYYPHNLFLEILLQGGAIFLVFSLWALWIMFIKLCKMQKNNNSLYLLLPFIIYPFVQLLFTGSYMETPFFWFSVMFVVNYDVSSKNTMIESSVRLNNSF